MLGEILWGIIGGAIIGVIGRFLLPGRQNISMLMTVVAGILGGVIGGLIAGWLGVGETRGIDWIRHAIQIALAMLFVWLAARMGGSKSATPPSGTTMPRPTR